MGGGGAWAAVRHKRVRARSAAVCVGKRSGASNELGGEQDGDNVGGVSMQNQQPASIVEENKCRDLENIEAINSFM